MYKADEERKEENLGEMEGTRKKHNLKWEKSENGRNRESGEYCIMFKKKHRIRSRHWRE